VARVRSITPRFSRNGGSTKSECRNPKQTPMIQTRMVETSSAGSGNLRESAQSADDFPSYYYLFNSCFLAQNSEKESHVTIEWRCLKALVSVPIRIFGSVVRISNVFALLTAHHSGHHTQFGTGPGGQTPFFREGKANSVNLILPTYTDQV